MIDDGLLNKFNHIRDLPVSEEMLGAYIEGNLSELEMDDVEMMLQYQPELNDLYEEVTCIPDFSILSDDGPDGFGTSDGFSFPFYSGEMETSDDYTLQEDISPDMEFSETDDEYQGTTDNWGNEDDDVFGLDLSSGDDFNLDF